MRERGNHERYWDLIERIITESDLVLEILDARLVELSRNEEVEKLIKEVGRPVIFVINKSDLVSKDSLRKQVKKLRMRGEVVFVSTKKNNVKILLYAIKKVFKKYGKSEKVFEEKPRYREARADIVVGVVGYPNVGKSSIINALAHKKKSKVSKKAGTTHGIHWIRATDEIKLIDSPGVIPLDREDEIRYGLIGARDSERLKNPELVAHALIKLFQQKTKKRFNEFYKIEMNHKSPEEVVEEIGRRKGHLLKGGRVDENRTVSMIVRDWQQGRLRL
jgi:hypothetical protein